MLFFLKNLAAGALCWEKISTFAKILTLCDRKDKDLF
jgi:hypothetical protein